MIVVDASIAVQWFVAEEGAELSASVLARPDLIAPGLLMVEVANALRRKIINGDIGKDEADQGFRLIAANVDLRLPSPPLLARALSMALEMGHPIYDCVYLGLAESSGARLLTRDREFAARVEKIKLGHLLATLPLEPGR